MATVVHGCGSPRQHPSNNISGPNGCLTSNSHHQHQPTTTPMYPTMPKYTRSSASPMAIVNHHHAYGGGANGAAVGHQYNPPLPPVTYLPVGAAAQPQPHQPHAIQQTYVAAPDACHSYWGHPHAATMMYRTGRHHNKRKSAVELLAETKPFYIRSDAVMERLHQSNFRTANFASGGQKRGRNNVDNREEVVRCNVAYAETNHMGGDRFIGQSHMHQGANRAMQYAHHYHHHSRHAHPARQNAAPGNNMLQSKLRTLLNTDGGSRERGSVSRAALECYRNDLPHQFDYGSKCLQPINSSPCSKELPPPYAAEDSGPIRIPPPAFLSPHSFDNAYSYAAENSSGDEPLVLTENYRPISPPAEYAAETNPTKNQQRYRYNYQRSYSHSHEMAAENAKYTAVTYNINSHKSLPDLHSQISRHSPHSEILSCCSRGNRSTKSAGESSLNRDSGGSSGHYTHRSEPCYRQRETEREITESKNCCNVATPIEFRRDSGSSTQHSANSYCGYASLPYPRNTDCAECRCKNAVTFDSTDYLLNFTTPEVPEAFQDDYTPPPSSMPKHKSEEVRYAGLTSQQLLTSHPYASSSKQNQNCTAQSPGSAPSVEEISPPPIQFKRQKCIRFKNRSRISLPPNATAQTSVMHEPSEMYHKAEQQTYFFPKCFPAEGYQAQERAAHAECNTADSDEPLSELEKFFDRLGLNDDKFYEIYNHPKRRRSAESDSDDSSTVFFSDVSTVDSMRLPDSTETQTQATQAYRPSEPPSIVERNARIIKWLCNCRKLQYA